MKEERFLWDNLRSLYGSRAAGPYRSGKPYGFKELEESLSQAFRPYVNYNRISWGESGVEPP
jgi:hypothetical protein